MNRRQNEINERVTKKEAKMKITVPQDLTPYILVGSGHQDILP